MASVIFLIAMGIVLTWFMIRNDKRLQLKHDKEMEKLELEIGKLLMRGDQDD
jgi:preprotein translocase subunit YajC